MVCFGIGLGVLGLIVGSFLNVVIIRLPAALFNNNPESTLLFHLLYPPSHCTQCGSKIRWRDNIPVFSFLWLKGKCRFCKTGISLQYPMVEILTAALSVVIGLHFGFTLQTASALLLVWALIALTVIDLNHSLLPDDITLPFVWLGLLVNSFEVFTTPASAIFGAISGYLSLWTVYWIFKLLTHKEGMGFGDFKLFALLGAWLGWQVLPFILFLASFFGTLVGLWMIFQQGKGKNTPIPFGPFLASAGLISLLFKQELLNVYFRLLTH